MLDSRTIPGAQTAEEVAEVIAGAIDSRDPDVYTRPDGREIVVKYFTKDRDGGFFHRFGLVRSRRSRGECPNDLRLLTSPNCGKIPRPYPNLVNATLTSRVVSVAGRHWTRMGAW